MLLGAEQDAARARFHSGTVLLDIRSAGFAHHSDPHESRLARVAETIEMCLHAFGKRTFSPSLSGTKLCDVPTAGLYDRGILAQRGGHRERHKHRNSQTNPSHVNLPLLARAAKYAIQAARGN